MLLLSVLPEPLAKEITKDSARTGKVPKKLYMKSYYPVSILLANICGFTELADRSAAQQVVEVLNDLYNCFDDLALKYSCNRIKLLGDCYYCVSGLPIETPLHAENCINMGLEIIEAIQPVREKFKTEVSMRVGVHSGKVHCGVLGNKDMAVHRARKAYSNKALTAKPSMKSIAPRGLEANNPLFSELQNEPEIEKHVNEILQNSITCRSLRQLKNSHCRRFLLNFRESTLERKYNKEPDRILQPYFSSAFIVNIVMNLVQFFILPLYEL